MVAETVVYRPIARPDVYPLAHLHLDAFPDFFMSSLGVGFLTEFYRGFCEDSSSISVVAVTKDGRILGAAVGSSSPSGFFKRLLSRRFFRFALHALIAVVKKPKNLLRLLRAVGYRGEVGGSAQDGALLSSICVGTEQQGNGLGSELLRVWLQVVRDRGIMSAHLTTDADNNDSANSFYVRNRWCLSSTYTTAEGRAMNHYSIDLSKGTVDD